MNENEKASLQILILNDLLSANVIDKDIHNKAVQKIKVIKNRPQVA